MCVNAETEINYSQIQLVLDFRYTFVRYIAALLGIGYGFRVDRSDPRSTTDRGCELCSERSPGTETELTFSSRKRCVVSSYLTVCPQKKEKCLPPWLSPRRCFLVHTERRDRCGGSDRGFVMGFVWF